MGRTALGGVGIVDGHVKAGTEECWIERSLDKDCYFIELLEVRAAFCSSLVELRHFPEEFLANLKWFSDNILVEAMGCLVMQGCWCHGDRNL